MNSQPGDQPARAPEPDAAPGVEEMRAYREGRLDLVRFEQIDAWLAALPGEEQARLLGDPAEWLPGLPPIAAASADLPVFATEPKRLRYRILHGIGAGGMGIVEAAYDDVLGREVALKRCRPRRPDESPATYAARLRAFKREAAITAQLEHPGIVPVHDVGSGTHGEPAFVMKKLEGVPLQSMIAHAFSGEALDLASIAETMLRLAEAMAYAHARGVVHRDLKPDNVIVGSLGAVYVIDWGLAAMALTSATRVPELPGQLPRAGNQSPTQHKREPASTAPTSAGIQATTAGTFRLGTPAWMAPEQFGPGTPDPRMDVFALGGLLMALLTGSGPRAAAQRQGRVVPSVDLSPLQTRALPRGLVAVARRCLAADPEQRYQDGAAVAEELRHWLSAGLTQAERPSPLTRLWVKMRHSPRLVAGLLGGTLVAALTLLLIFAQNSRQQALQEQHDQRVLGDLARNLDIGNEGEVHSALKQVQSILKDHLDLAAGQALLTRLNAAEDVFAAKSAQKRLQDRLNQLREKYLQKGPWDSESDELLDAIRAAGYLGLDTLDDGDLISAEAAQLRGNPLLDDLLAALVRLERTMLLRDPRPPLSVTIPKLIAAAGNTPGWRAVGDVLAQTTVEEHELLFPHCPAADVALQEAVTADQLLATFSPEPRLIAVARERWHRDTNAFWPRVISARDSIARSEWREAERHALVALGREPDSLWPHLILAYVALADHDDEALLREAQAGLLQNPAHLELVLLKAAGLARTHHLAEAQLLIDHSGEQHLLYHLQHHSEHPLEHSVEALIAAGIHIPGATAPPAPPTPPAPLAPPVPTK